MMRVRTFAMPQLPFFLGNIALDFYHHSMLPKKIAFAFGIAVFVGSNLNQQPVVGQQPGKDEEFERAASEIASARINQALRRYWNDQDGFSLPPMKAEEAVSEYDTERIKKLDEENPTIWKSIDPIFADRYRHLQAPVNDKHLKSLRATRALITEGINDAVDARGGGSTSGMLRAFGGAETEWILRQLYSSSAPSISKTQFTSKLRSNIFYQDSTGDPEAQRSFERAIDKFRQAEATMSDAQQATFRREILAYFE